MNSPSVDQTEVAIQNLLTIRGQYPAVFRNFGLEQVLKALQIEASQKREGKFSMTGALTEFFKGMSKGA